MRYGVAQIGARRHYAVPRGLHAAGRLERLVTDACAEIPPWRWLRAVPRAVQGAALQRLLGRRVEGVPPRRIRGLLGFTVSGLIERRGNPEEGQVVRWVRRNRAFGEAAVARGFGAADALYAFNGAGLEVLRAARAGGRAAVLDQTSLPWCEYTRRLREEYDRHPGWETRAAELDETGEMAAREEEEWRLADAIVCGSEAVRDALLAAGVPAARVAVVPYGIDVSRYAVAGGGAAAPGKETGPLRVLFAGKVQLSKGVAYLLDAARRLPPGAVAMRLVGPVALAPRALEELREAGIAVEGAVPRDRMPAVYADAQAFIFPSLAEGSANVCYEALAAGLPVVATREAGSVVRDGVEGLLVPAADGEALAAALERLVRDPGFRLHLARGARERAAAFSAEGYGPRLSRALDGVLAGRSDGEGAAP